MLSYRAMFNWLQKRATKSEGIHPRDPVLAEWLGQFAQSSAGVSVTPETALAVSAVFACVRVLAETLAVTPIELYRRGPEDTREKAKDHRLYPIVRRQPNRLLNSFQWRELSMVWLLLRGVAYSRIRIDATGRMRLIPLPVTSVRAFLVDEDKIAYEYMPDSGQREILLQEEVLRIPFMLRDAVTPITIIQSQRESIGGALASQEYANRFFANDATPRGLLEYPGFFKDREKAKEFVKWFKDQVTGSNRHSPALLENGMKYTEIGMTNDDAQFIESRKFSVTDVARIFRVQPHLIGDLERSTFTNIEHQSIEFIQYSMLPWYTRWEQALNATLLSPTEQEEFYFEFNPDALLRGDTLTRYRAYSIGRQWGWFSRNDVRRKENEPPVDGGDDYLTPVNMAPIGNVAEEDVGGGEKPLQRLRLIGGGE